MLLPILLGLLGAIVGSFLATMVVRWTDGRSVVAGRSGCDGCGRALSPVELVPLVSAMVLRGRCRSCGAAIDPVHWRVELACLLVGVSAGLVASPGEAVAGAAFGWLLVTLAALDLRRWWLPDRLTGMLALAGLASGVAGLEPPFVDRLVGGAAGFALLWAVAAGYRRVRGREGMGGGDPKLFGAIGLWLGWPMLPPVLLFSCLLGLGIALFAKLTGRAMTWVAPVQLGALLAAAAYPAWLLMVASRA